MSKYKLLSSSYVLLYQYFCYNEWTNLNQNISTASTKDSEYTNSSKIPFTPYVADFAKQFLEASDWFSAYNRGKVFNLS